MGDEFYCLSVLCFFAVCENGASRAEMVIFERWQESQSNEENQ